MGLEAVRKGRIIQNMAFGRKSVIAYIAVDVIQNRRGGRLTKQARLLLLLLSDLFFVKTIALVGSPADAFQDRTHPTIGFQNPGHL